MPPDEQNPIDDIEQVKGFADLGRTAVIAYEAALEEAEGNVEIAHAAVVSLFIAMFTARFVKGEDEK